MQKSKLSKYHAKKTEVDGITFDSKREAERYIYLKGLEAEGEITDLQRQVRFQLIPSQKRPDGKTERACTYIADFVYWQNGQRVVEDVKGVETDTYKIKRKLMLYLLGILIKEVR